MDAKDKFVVTNVYEGFAIAKNNDGIEMVIPNDYTCYIAGDEFSKEQFKRQQSNIIKLMCGRDDQWRKLIELTFHINLNNNHDAIRFKRTA